MRRSKKGEQAAEEQVPEPTSFEIGYNRTVEEFRQAFDDAGAQQELWRGAIKAFREDRPKNIQALLANPGAFGMKDLTDDNEKGHCRIILFILIQDKDDASDIITHAIEEIPVQQKQKFLDAILFSAISCNPYEGEEPFVAALLGAGANANAENNGAGGRTLAFAITKGHSTGVIRQLCDHGATLAEAELRIRTRPYWDQDDLRKKCIEKLKVYRQEITGAPATVEVRPELLLEMQQMIEDLTAKVNVLTKLTVPADVPAKNRTLKMSS